MIKKVILGVLCVLILFIVFFTTVFTHGNNSCTPTKSDGALQSGDFAYPVAPDTPISSGYGPRGGGFHQGVDLAAPLDSPIYAFANGVVIAARDTGVDGFGGWVVIDHEIDGKKISTVYGHENPGGIDVKVGDQVKAGQKIAKVGNAGESSGPHLHFQVWEGGRIPDGIGHSVNPEDEWLKKAKSSSKSTDSHESVPQSGPDDKGTEEKPKDEESTQDLRASQIVARGEERKEPEEVILAALAAAKVESNMKMLASRAVPESMEYPNDGVAPGDADSVGLFQTRVSIHGPTRGGVKGLMDPTTQIDWFYDTARGLSGKPGEIAANVERPREDLRYKYGLQEDFARKKFAQFSGHGTSSLGSKSAEDCGSSGDGTAPTSELGEKILEAARKKFGLPYVWGGGDWNGPTQGGFDCSGLTMYAVYQASDGKIQLLHHTDEQEAHPQMKTVSWEERQPGDLLYFAGSSAENPGEKFHHVSIYSGEKDGIAMQYEAQTYGVNSGEYPVRLGETIVVKRAVLPDSNSEEKEEK